MHGPHRSYHDEPAMIREFTTLLGHRVDVAVKPALKPLIRATVLADARLIYQV